MFLKAVCGFYRNKGDDRPNIFGLNWSPIILRLQAAVIFRSLEVHSTKGKQANVGSIFSKKKKKEKKIKNKTKCQ